MATESTEIEPAGPEDESAITPLMVAFNANEGIAWRPEAMGAALRRMLREPELGVVLVARHARSRSVVGYSLGSFGYDLEFAGRDGFITELFVADSFRGRGLGSALLEAMIAKLRVSGANAVHLMVRPENDGARRLYESSGFRAVPRILMTKVFPA